ncbi:MAG: hypothetical protein ACYCWE_02890 [Eubacteriales bacterium]
MYNADFIQHLKRSNISVDGEKTKERVEKMWKNATSEMKTQIQQDADCSRASIYRIYTTGAVSAKMVIPFDQKLNVDPYYLTGETDENNGYKEETIDRFLRDKGYSKLLNGSAIAEKPKKRAYKKKVVPENQPEEASNAASSEEVAKDDTTTSDINRETEIVKVPNPDSEDIISSNPNTRESVPKKLPEEASNTTSGEEVAKDNIANSEIKSETEIVKVPNPESEDDLSSLTEEDMNLILHSLFIRARVSKKAGERLEKIKHMLVD